MLVLAACTPPPVGEAPPRVLAVALTPSSPTVEDVIVADVVLDDPRGVTLDFVWEVDGERVRVLGPALDQAFARQDTVRVTVRPRRDGLVGEPFASDVLTVADAPPRPLGDATLTPATPRAWLQDLVCVPPAEVVDPDGDAVTWSFTWTRDGVDATGLAVDGELPGDTIPADTLVDGEVWACTAAVGDGELETRLVPVRATVARGVRPSFGVPVTGPGVSCVLGDDGEARCWGQDGRERLASPPPGPFARLWLGSRFGCGLRATTLELACWGATDVRTTDVPTGPVVDAALGEAHGCALRPDGTAVCWGWDDVGQATPPDGTFQAIFAGLATTCALDTQGQLRCWGADVGGDELAGLALRTVAIGAEHLCGVTVDGALACAGDASYGQTLPPDGTWRDVGATFGQTAALRDDGAVVAFGMVDGAWRVGATDLSLGLGFQWCAGTPAGVICGSVDPSARPSAYLEDVAPREAWSALALEERLICGLDGSGRAACLGAWGSVGLPDVPLTEVAAGGDVACGVRGDDGLATCWGWLDRAGLDAPPPVRLTGLAVSDGYACGLDASSRPRCWGARAPVPPDVALVSLDAAPDFACGLTAAGTAVCFGAQDARALPPAGAFAALDLAREHGCGLKPNGKVLCWGRRGVPAADDGPFVAIAVTDDRACGLRANGRPRCWGDAVSGALEPVPAPTLVDLAGGTDRVCGRTPTGGLVCWGELRRQPLP